MKAQERDELLDVFKARFARTRRPFESINHRPLKPYALALLLLSAILTGCYPHVRTYPHLEIAGATYGGEICGVGAPVTVSFEAGGIRYAVNLEPGSYAGGKPWIRLRAPEDMPIGIVDLSATFITGGREIRVALEPSDGTVVREGLLRRREVVIEKGVASEKFTGASTYTLRFSQVPDLESGELQLPDLTLGSSPVRGPRLRYERRVFTGVLPLNC